MKCSSAHPIAGYCQDDRGSDGLHVSAQTLVDGEDRWPTTTCWIDPKDTA